MIARMPSAPQPEHVNFEILFGPHHGTILKMPADSHRVVLAHDGEQHIYIRTNSDRVLINLDHMFGGDE